MSYVISDQLADYQRFVDDRLLHALASQSLLSVFCAADGSWLVDAVGDRFLDMTCSFGAAHLGHNHPRITQSLLQVANGESPMLHPFGMLPQSGELARSLCEVAGRGMQKVLFCTSGSEALNIALQLAMNITGNSAYVVLEGSYQSYSHASTAEKPIIVKRAIDAVPEVRSGAVAALILELIHGSNGAQLLDEDQVCSIVRECKMAGVPVILDEVLTGIGRTGSWFAFQHYPEVVQPDFVVCSKGLTGGCIPVSAILMTDVAYERASMEAGLLRYRSTMSGCTLSIQIASTVIQAIKEEALLENCRARSAEIVSGLHQLAAQGMGISDINGRGLLIAFRPYDSSSDEWAGFRCMQRLYEKRVLCSVALGNPNYVTITPALNITAPDVQSFLGSLRSVLL